MKKRVGGPQADEDSARKGAVDPERRVDDPEVEGAHSTLSGELFKHIRITIEWKVR